MSKLSVFIIIGLAFLLGAVLATGTVWYMVAIKPLQSKATDVIDTSKEAVTEVVSDVMEREDVQQAVETVKEKTSEVAAEVEDAVTIAASDLPQNQQEILETIGLGDAEFTLTQTMRACAEEKVGKERVAEFIAGSIPGPLEVTLLLGCVNPE